MAINIMFVWLKGALDTTLCDKVCQVGGFLQFPPPIKLTATI
jgi:hypothetical protein